MKRTLDNSLMNNHLQQFMSERESVVNEEQEHISMATADFKNRLVLNPNNMPIHSGAIKTPKFSVSSPNVKFLDAETYKNEQSRSKQHTQKMSLVSDEVNNVVNDFFKDKISIIQSRPEPHQLNSGMAHGQQNYFETLNEEDDLRDL
jgi:hypothetical protein